MNSCWTMVPLSEVLEQNKNYIDTPQQKIYTKLSVRLYGKGVVLDAPADGATLKMKRHQIARSGQVILSEIWGKKGAIGLVPPQGDGALCTSHFFLFDVRTERIDPDYLQLIFTANYLQPQLERQAKGATGYAAVRPMNLLSARIPLPPLEEQARVVFTVQNLLGKLEEARKLDDEASEKTRGLMNAVLQNLDFSDYYVISKRIGDCCSMKTGKTPPTHISAYYGGDIDWYCPGDLDFTENGYVKGSSRKISELAVKDNKATVHEEDTILLVAIGSIGKVAMARQTCSSNQQITGIKFNEEIEPRYGYYWIRKSFSEITKKASQTTLPIINQQKIGSLEITYPKDIGIQRRVVAYLDSVQEKVNELRRLHYETVRGMEDLGSCVLDRAFIGEP